MPPSIATIVFALGIIGLFVLNRDRTARTSFALWLAVVWLCIGGSRMVSNWLQPPSPPAGSFGATAAAEQLLDGSPLDRDVLKTLVVIGIAVLLTRRATVKTVLCASAPLLVF